MTKYQRALQIWSILICAAKERKTYTYGGIADMLGFEGAGGITQMLGPIVHYCYKYKLPPLTLLVVNQETGMPSHELFTVTKSNMPQRREEVFHFDWFALRPPQIEDFQEADHR
ncbi:hypothetical protein [Halodesulfovibrio marinisediminis]|uniref:Uncharacterized protein n=1 Tax=Halodesulfovibrio marinisediminis DSM 17456 TaxID=1121457 RepID=A0A1N6I0C3_9BACT|nr:hypothetical protein [Halodesulfovibrio marinisediminis]SIO25456.1 hypothetical protein SAMN02745161_2317 [Halodesulfovibrio marinisediminis DSM 17456]